MAKVKQPYADERRVPWLDDRLVRPGEVVAVPDADTASYLEAGWLPADARTRKLGEQLLADKKISVFAGDPARTEGEPA